MMDPEPVAPSPEPESVVQVVPVISSPNPQDVVMSEEPFNADNNLQTFELFMRLEREVRKRIWKLNLPGPRLVEVIEVDGEYYSSAFRVINLQVCKESRREAFKTHPVSFSVDYNAPLIPFCFEMDTLLLAGNIEHPTEFKRFCNPKDLAKVQRLVVDRKVEWGNRTMDNRGSGLGGMSRLIFSGVKDYTCIFTGGVDTLPGWAEAKWFPYIGCPWQRKANHNSADAVQSLKVRWPAVLELRTGLSKLDCESNRFGGIAYKVKYEPAIRLWDIPRVYTMGVERYIEEQFRNSNRSRWEELIMDRAIEDIFD